ncbi:MAG: glycosyltransferase family 9 protein [Armatimonadota bacterium]
MSTISKTENTEMSQVAGRGAEREAPRIVIIKRSSLGDIIHAMPVACALRETYPDAYIAWVVETRFEQVLDGHSALDEIIAVRHPLENPLKVISDLRTIYRELHSRHFDWAIDLQGLLKSAVVLMLSGASRKIGIEGHQRELSNLIVNEQVSPHGQIHAVEYYLAVARHLGAAPEKITFGLAVDPEAAQWTNTFLADHGMRDGRPLVGINPTTARADKEWEPARFVQAANSIQGVNWIITGAPSDRELAEAIAGGIDGPAAVTAGHTDIARLVALINRLDLLVSCDSGPLHIAVALDIPTIALFGPTNPHLTGPIGDIHTVLWHKNPDSDGTPGPHLGSMDDITVDEVVEALRNLLRA